VAVEGCILCVIILCGLSGWYVPFVELVNVWWMSFAYVEVFYMDECLDWEGCDILCLYFYSFCGFMEWYFYGLIDVELVVLEGNWYWLELVWLVEIMVDLL